MYDTIESIVLAQVLKGTSCPICEGAWACGQDVFERKPILDEEGGVCTECSRTLVGIEDRRDQMALSHLHQCIEERDRLPSRDHEFLANIFGLVEAGEELDAASCERLFRIHQRLFEEN